MACPPFSEILMVSQNVRSGGERQRGIDTLIYKTTPKSPIFGKFGRCIAFFVERKKSVRCPWQNTDFFRIGLWNCTSGGRYVWIAPSLVPPLISIKSHRIPLSSEHSENRYPDILFIRQKSTDIIRAYPLKWGQAPHSFCQRGYHSAVIHLRPYGFASPPFDGFALGSIYFWMHFLFLLFKFQITLSHKSNNRFSWKIIFR